MTLRLTPEQFAAAQARAKRKAEAAEEVRVWTMPAAKAKPTRADLPAHAPRPNKFKARKTGGYASAKEARRAQELKLLRDALRIWNLQEQVVYELIPAQYDRNGKLLELACKYVADFVYIQVEDIDGRAVQVQYVEDVKSPASRTAEYIIKRKLMLHVHGISIRET